MMMMLHVCVEEVVQCGMRYIAVYIYTIVVYIYMIRTRERERGALEISISNNPPFYYHFENV